MFIFRLTLLFKLTLLKITPLFRLDMLERLCVTWHGWVSAAVYLPLPTARSAQLLNQTVVKLSGFHASIQLTGESGHTSKLTPCIFCGDKTFILTTNYVFPYLAGRLGAASDSIQWLPVLAWASTALLCDTTVFKAAR